MKNFSVVVTLLHVGKGKSNVCTISIVKTQKLELDPDLNYMYNVYTTSVCMFICCTANYIALPHYIDA